MLAHISEKHKINSNKDLVVEEVEDVLNEGNVGDSVNLKSSNEFKCDQCESKFKKKENCFVSTKELKNHMKQKHRKEKGSKQNNAEVCLSVCLCVCAIGCSFFRGFSLHSVKTMEEMYIHNIFYY